MRVITLSRVASAWLSVFGLALFVASTGVQAQLVAPRRLPEPMLVDTPWGDFPLERLLPGARLRLTSPSGRTVVQVAALRDSTLDVYSAGGDSLPPLTFAQLRTLQRVEVRARPVWGERAGNYGLLIGAAAGALVGVAAHNGPSTGRWHRASLSDAVLSWAGVGSFAGFMTSRLVIARTRWRPVTLP